MKDKIKDECWSKFCETHPTLSQTYPVQKVFDFIFDYIHDNLTSDAEGEEEMLFVSRKRVQGIYKQADSLETCNALDALFGSKCLPEACNDACNDASNESKPAEPSDFICKKKSNSKSHIVVNSEMVDSIIKDSFREHNRLHIATQMASAILGSEMALKRDGKKESKTPANVARAAFEFADALMSECEKGGQQ